MDNDSTRRHTTHNWLVQQIHDELLAQKISRYATGILVDLGCGVSPYRKWTDAHVKLHIGIDHPGSPHGGKGVDLYAAAYDTGIASAKVDTVLCTMVLEHLESPQAAFCEVERILKPGGYFILSAPLFWHLHEEPRDFFRYTKYGLMHLAATARLETVEVNPLAGFVVTFAQELAYFLNRWKRGALQQPITVAQKWIQVVAHKLHRHDHSHAFTWAYLAIFRKAQSANG